MKKNDKSPDKAKKKAGKKKKIGSGGELHFNSKQLQKEFNKRMKVLVQEVKKDTQKAIKALLKEARQKIRDSEDFVRHDVLKTIAAQYENVVETIIPSAAENRPVRRTRTKAATVTSTGPATAMAPAEEARPRPAAKTAASAPSSRPRKTPGLSSLHGQGQAA